MNGLVAYLTENCCGTGSKHCASVCEPRKSARSSKRSARAA
jgi:hypothetical protein